MLEVPRAWEIWNWFDISVMTRSILPLAAPSTSLVDKSNLTPAWLGVMRTHLESRIPSLFERRIAICRFDAFFDLEFSFRSALWMELTLYIGRSISAIVCSTSQNQETKTQESEKRG